MRRRVAALALGLALAACGPAQVQPGAAGGERAQPADELPRLPALDGVEPAVRARLVERHAAVLAAPADGAAWGRYARALHAHDFGPAARRAYRRAAALSPPQQRFAHLYLAGHSASLEEPEQARVLFEQALLIAGTPELHLRLAQNHERGGRLERASIHYETALLLAESSHAHLGLGRLALAADDVPAAIAALERARALAPAAGEVHAALARAYARAGREREAAQATAAAGDLDDDPGFVDPLLFAMLQEGVSYSSHERLALACLSAGRLDDALVHIERALAARPGAAQASFHKGRILAALGRLDEAAVCFQSVLASQAEHVGSLVMLAACRASAGAAGEAVQLATRALVLDSRNLDAHYTVGVVLQAVRPEQAAGHLRYVLQERPERADARLALAQLQRDQGRPDEARATLAWFVERGAGRVPPEVVEQARRLLADLPAAGG